MQNENEAGTSVEPVVSRRDSVRLAAALALGAGLGVPSQLLGATTAARMQLRLYKAATDGGQFVGSVEFTDAATAFITSAEGARAQLKWYDGTGQEVLSMAMPKMCCIKTKP